MNLIQTKYLVPESNMAKITKEIDRLNRRAVKLNCPTILLSKTGKSEIRWGLKQPGTGKVEYFTEKEVQKKITLKWKDTKQRISWIEVSVTGASPTLNGWDFVATLSPLANDTGGRENLIRSVPGKMCPTHMSQRVGQCDHCQENRYRTETFVVQSTQTGQYKCVGRQCLKDFLGYNKDPHEFVKQMEMLIGLDSFLKNQSSGMGGGVYQWDLKHYLQTTASVIRLNGWTSRTKARQEDKTATADFVNWLLLPPGGDKKDKEHHRKELERHAIIPKDQEDTEAAIEWLVDMEEKEIQQSEYLTNINLIARHGLVETKLSGYAASIIAAYNRNVDELKRKALPVATGGHYSEIEKKFDNLHVKCIKTHQYQTAKWVITFVTQEGNHLTWFGNQGLILGQEYDITGKVKKHTEYQGVKQTQVSVAGWREHLSEPEKAVVKTKQNLRKKAKSAK